MAKVRVTLVKYDMDKTKKRKRKDMMVAGKTEADVINQLEKIHKGEKVVNIHEIVWDEAQILKSERNDERKRNSTFKGTVKFFEIEKGFGFIEPEKDIPDVFFHVSALGGQDVYDHDQVEFEIGEGPKGPCAIHIKVITE